MKRKLGLYIITCCVSFTVLVLIHSVAQFMDWGLSIDPASTLQMFGVTALISTLMWITDRFFPPEFTPEQMLSQIACVLVSVFGLGGGVFKWFPFTWATALGVLGITLVIYLVVLAVLELRARTDAEYINKIIKKKNKGNKEDTPHGRV